MKKYLVILFLSLSVLAYAETTLINPGYSLSTNWFNSNTITLHSFTANYISLSENNIYGIPDYLHIDPYFGLGTTDTNGSQDILVENNSFVFGVTGLFGYGKNFVQGQVGLLIGGGFLLDTNFMLGQLFAMQFSAGLGTGANFHIKLGSGNLLFNVGLTLGWNPVSFMLHENDFGSNLRPGQFITNFNLGLGWITQ